MRLTKEEKLRKANERFRLDIEELKLMLEKSKLALEDCRLALIQSRQQVKSLSGRLETSERKRLLLKEELDRRKRPWLYRLNGTDVSTD